MPDDTTNCPQDGLGATFSVVVIVVVSDTNSECPPPPSQLLILPIVTKMNLLSLKIA
jgi:hypothetical protein